MSIQVDWVSIVVLLGMVISAVITANTRKLAGYFRKFLLKVFGTKTNEVSESIAKTLIEFAEELKALDVNGNKNIVTNTQIEDVLQKRLQGGENNEKRRVTSR